MTLLRFPRHLRLVADNPPAENTSDMQAAWMDFQAARELAEISPSDENRAALIEARRRFLRRWGVTADHGGAA